jgi:hypothetical protein
MTSSVLQLDPNRVMTSIELLAQRVEERFPGAGLAEVGRQLLGVARQAGERSESIARPNLLLRAAVLLLLGLIGAGLLTTLATLDIPAQGLDLIDFVLVLESGINDVVLIGAAVFFLITLDNRLQRGRGLKAIHELRSIAHVIDMHQLTKDPERVFSDAQNTPHSPRRTMTPAELGRYLDYCSEMLSLTGKVAAIYVSEFDDPVLLAAVNEVVTLTTGLSRKVWQKLALLRRAA